ncbi:MAG: PQQ-dependent sugar dehydrogenase [Micropepsaceae bacterium]
MHKRWLLATAFAMAGQTAMADVLPDPIRPPPPPPSAAKSVSTGYKVVEVAKGLDHPYSVAFLPDGAILVTERAGRLRIVRNGQLQPQPVSGVPPVHSGGQAGLFDIVLHPKFVENNFVYITYAHGTPAANATRVARARFDGTSLQDVKVIFEASPLKDTNNHYGGRLAFLSDGTFALTVGDGFEYREKAQDLTTHLGKIVRLNDDGSVPDGNPFSIGGARRENWSSGHRNQQGLAFDAETGKLWEHEHGPQGGDELNVIEPQFNYGWPVITYGMDYSGAYVSPFTARQGMQQAVLQWTPSIAPSGLAIYRGDKFPAWNGDLLLGALAFKHLRRIDLDAQGNVVGQEELLKELNERIRDVRVSPDGFVYVTTDNAPTGEKTGRVLRLEP